MKIFHISKFCFDNNILKPSIPNNEFTRRGIENNSIPRICFAPSIEKCLKALNIDIHVPNQCFYIHEPINYDDLLIITNKEIIDNNYVPNAIHTGELWVLNPCKVKCEGIISF